MYMLYITYIYIYIYIYITLSIYIYITQSTYACRMLGTHTISENDNVPQSL